MRSPETLNHLEGKLNIADNFQSLFSVGILIRKEDVQLPKSHITKGLNQVFRVKEVP